MAGTCINKSILTAKNVISPHFNEPHETDSLKVMHKKFLGGEVRRVVNFHVCPVTIYNKHLSVSPSMCLSERNAHLSRDHQLCQALTTL